MKISRIELNDFEAFPKPITFDLKQGRNLLLYGENGSGKSSLYRALRELFNLRTGKPYAKHQNVFKDPLGSDGYIRILFSDHQPPIEWLYGANRPTTDQRLVQGSHRLGCIDYRALLDTNYVFKDGAINLFDVLIEGVLQSWLIDVEGRGKIQLETLWEETKALRILKPKKRIKRKIDDAERAVAAFNSILKTYLKHLEIKAQELLKRLHMHHLEIKLYFPGIRLDSDNRDFIERTIRLLVTFNNKPISAPQKFLNESRLTAIALSLYFASLLETVPADPQWPRILILDDVLIGLDMGNRLPVLDIIQEDFKDWQVLLLTHSREWYEVAKQRMNGWCHYEIFNCRVGDYEQPILVHDEDHLYRALNFLADGQIKAAAVHVRTKFELVLKWACQKLDIRVKYRLNPRKLPASDLWSALKSETIKVKTLPNYAINGQGQVVRWPSKPKEVRVIHIDLETRVQHAVSWVLNPLSHSLSVDPYRAEIEDAIFAIDEVELAVINAMYLKSLNPITLLLLLQRILGSRLSTLVEVSHADT
ncbi:MAG: ATP-binding cassette domain-containing protein [Candidatus Thorarchaeota archaeon]